MEAETGVIWPQAKEVLEPPELERARQEPLGPLKECCPAGPLDSNFWPPKV